MVVATVDKQSAMQCFSVIIAIIIFLFPSIYLESMLSGLNVLHGNISCTVTNLYASCPHSFLFSLTVSFLFPSATVVGKGKMLSL